MAKEIGIVEFDGFKINLDRENAVELCFNFKGEDKAISVGKQLQIKVIDSDNINLNIREMKNLFSTLMVYTKDTLFLETSRDVKDAIDSLYAENNDINEVFVLKTAQYIYIGKGTDHIDVKSRKLQAIDSGTQEDRSKTEQKSSLKAYETPQKLHNLTFSLIEQYSLVPIIEKEARNIIGLYKSSETIEINGKEVAFKDLFKAETDISKEKIAMLLPAMTKVIQSSFNKTVRDQIETSANEKSTLNQLYNFTQKYNKEIFEKWSKIGASIFPFKELDKQQKASLPTMQIIDFQAGSGKDILGSAKLANFPMYLQGTEIRKISEVIDKDEELDEKNLVLYDVNFGLHDGDYKRLFDNDKLQKNTDSSIIYLNPPYTSNNSLAKDSIETVAHNKLFFGLFPTSMREFIAKNINGHIFDIPRSLTGYTDKNTPERFLYVIAQRNDEIEVENTATKETTLLNQKRVTNEVTVINESDVYEAKKKIMQQVAKKRDDLSTLYRTYFNFLSYHFIS